jgi:hypothetical protein
MKGRALQSSLAVAAALLAALYVGRALAPDATLFQQALREGVLIRLAALAKLAFLGLASWHAARAGARLEPGNPARTAWGLLALGLLAFALGQGVLSAYQLATGKTPFPTVGDFFFIAAYPLLIAAFARFIRAYRETGYPVGSDAEHATLAAVVVVASVVLAYRLLRPALEADAPALERILNAAYPAFDFVLLVPIAILVRVAWPFRGGAIFRAWTTLLAGMLALCAGDILFAWFSMLGAQHLDSFLHAAYLVSYFCLARGTLLHRELLGS